MRNIFTFLSLLVFFISSAQDGSLDVFNYGTGGKEVTFATNGTNSSPLPVLNQPQKIFILGSGKILHCYTVDNSGDNNFGMVRYNSDGSVDGTFGTNGYVMTDFGGDDQAFALTVAASGQIILVGKSSTSMAIAVYTSGGVLDATFDGDGKKTLAIGTDAVANAVVESGGVITVAGTANTGSHYDFALARLSITGTLDAAFDGNSGSGNGIVTTSINGVSDVINAIALQSDGKIVVAGGSVNGTINQFALARYNNTDGVLDTGFDGDGIVTTTVTAIANSDDEANGVAIDNSTGKIVAVGSSKIATNNYDFAVVRYSSSGALDASFDSDGKLTKAIGSGNDIAYDVIIQSNGKILVAGTTLAAGPTNDFAITRLNTGGTTDNTFGETSAGLTTIDFTGASDDYGYDIASGTNYIMFGGVSGTGLGTARLINTSTVLPVHLITFTAGKLSKSVMLNWESANEQTVQTYEIERSTDAIHFAKIGSLSATGNTNYLKDYSFEDIQPLPVSFYRLRIINTNNSVEYSKIVVVKFENSSLLQAFPNPVKNNLNVQITQPKGAIQLRLFDISGRLVKAYELESNGSTLSSTIDLSSIQRGIYFLRANNQVVKLLKE
jgi:uncharacterized delta-60 repeat protein